MHLISGEADFTKLFFEAVSENGEIHIKKYLRLNNLLSNEMFADEVSYIFFKVKF